MTDTFMAGVSNLGNTVGNTGTVSNQLILVGGNNVTLSQGTDANGATVTISAFDQTVPTINFYQPLLAGSATIQLVNGSMYLTPVVPTGDVFPGNMTVQTMDVVMKVNSIPTAITNANTVSFFAGLYTMNNSMLSLASSAVSTLAEAQNVNNSQSWNGQRHFTFAPTLWDTQPALTQGEYWMGMMMNQSGAGAGLTCVIPGQAFETHSLNGTFGQTVTTTPEIAVMPFAGAYSVTSASLPTSLQNSDLIHAQSVPYFAFNNQLSAY